MDCYECAAHGDTVAAAGICLHCGAGLCPTHLGEAARFRVGGTRYACSHRPGRAAAARKAVVSARIPAAQALEPAKAG